MPKRLPQNEDESYSDEETERRAREAIRRSFEMPHKPQKEMVGTVGRRAQNKRGTKPSKSAPKAR